MSNALKKVQPGDPLAIPAATFNTFVDAAQDFLRRQRDVARTPVADRPPFETVLLKNASGADRGRFDVLGIDAPVFTPSNNGRPNRTNIVIGEITVASKKGWEYVWARLQTAMHRRLETSSATPTPRTPPSSIR